jgi:hypothetical protein
LPGNSAGSGEIGKIWKQPIAPSADSVKGQASKGYDLADFLLEVDELMTPITRELKGWKPTI